MNATESEGGSTGADGQADLPEANWITGRRFPPDSVYGRPGINQMTAYSGTLLTAAADSTAARCGQFRATMPTGEILLTMP